MAVAQSARRLLPKLSFHLVQSPRNGDLLHVSPVHVPTLVLTQSPSKDRRAEHAGRPSLGNDLSMSIVRRHPRFSAEFTHPLYSSETDEFAPFGSDEGADLLRSWAQRSADLTAGATLRTILVDGTDEPDQLWAEFAQADPPAELDAIVIAAGRAMVLQALLRSRQHSPAGARQFDQMIQDLGGEVPTTSPESDDSPEMFDPGIDPPTQRHSWLFLHYHNSEVRLPHSYSQHFSWLQHALNDRPEWWQWWDAGFSGEPTVLGGWITFSDRPRRATVSSKVNDHWRWVDVSLRMSTGSFAALDRHELAQYSPTFVREARTAVSDILGAAAKKFSLGDHPEIPFTKRELAEIETAK